MVFGYDDKIIRPVVESNVPLLIFKDGGEFSKEFQTENISKTFKIICPPKTFQVQNPKNKKNIDIHGAFHSKLYLIKFKEFLRVVIGSANLFENDWDNWNNILWLQDFSLL